MDKNTVPTKKNLDDKAEELHKLWVAARKASNLAAACEKEYKDMRYKYYANEYEDSVAVLEGNHVG